MGKQALNTYVEPYQKARLERIARRRRVSQATLVREAIAEFIARHDAEGPEGSVEDAWGRMLGGYYSGSGAPNDPDDIYGS
jgi:predicted transcriptional regulator